MRTQTFTTDEIAIMIAKSRKAAQEGVVSKSSFAMFMTILMAMFETDFLFEAVNISAMTNLKPNEDEHQD